MQPSVSRTPIIGCVWQTSGEHNTTWLSLRVTMRMDLEKVMFLVPYVYIIKTVSLVFDVDEFCCTRTVAPLE